MTKTQRIFIFTALCLSTGVAYSAVWGTGVFQQEIQRKKVKRVKRPEFSERDSSGIYFSNVFDEAIKGDRPTVIASNTQTTNPPIGQGDSSTDTDDGSFEWSNYITGDVIETEIKRLEKQLAQQVTSPGKYKTGYKEARYSFQMLSMLFGIIIEHNEEVRWKRAANLAQPSFAVAAKNARRGDSDSYNYAIARRDDLTELIRGGNMTSTEKPAETVVWKDTIARSPLMQRLQDSVDKVKPMLSDKQEFAANKEEILHEANFLAAISEVLLKESMDESDDEDYIEFSSNMSSAARLMMSNVVSDNYDAVSQGFNQVNQACSDCHDIFR
jgi:cytochrome c556